LYLWERCVCVTWQVGVSVTEHTKRKEWSLGTLVWKR